MTHVIQQAKRFLSIAVLITACSAGALRSPPDATALTFTGCALQGGFCDASNTCRRQDFVPERGLVETVFGRCDERGDFGGPSKGATLERAPRHSGSWTVRTKRSPPPRTRSR
jgi:hypothetical protein